MLFFRLIKQIKASSLHYSINIAIIIHSRNSIIRDLFGLFRRLVGADLCLCHTLRRCSDSAFQRLGRWSETAAASPTQHRHHQPQTNAPGQPPVSSVRSGESQLTALQHTSLRLRMTDTSHFFLPPSKLSANRLSGGFQCF